LVEWLASLAAHCCDILPAATAAAHSAWQVMACLALHADVVGDAHVEHCSLIRL
jgi:hypothetical protein